jgi:hypothetical protein
MLTNDDLFIDFEDFYDAATKITTIPYDFNEKYIFIYSDTIEIIFHDDWKNYQISLFNQKIRKDVLPIGLIRLTFGCCFNQQIKENVLPNTLICLKFGERYNQEIKEKVMPNSLKYLIFGRDFDKEINENILPANLTHLTFGHYFDKEIKEKVLPDSLTHLTFGFIYNQKIKEKVLPTNLTCLIFDSCYSQEIEPTVIPLSVRELGFYSYNSLKNNIPYFIETVNIFFDYSDTYTQKISNIPITVKKIKINNKDKIHFLEKIPFDTVVEIVNI